MPARILTEPAKPIDAVLVIAPTDTRPGLLRINNADYHVIGPDVTEVRTLYKFFHVELFDDPNTYECWETEHGLHGCTCPAAEFQPRRACRHLFALYDVGLLSRFPPPGCGPLAKAPLEVSA